MVSLSTLFFDFIMEPAAGGARAIVGSSQLFLPGFMADPFPKSVILEIPATSTPTFFFPVPSPESRRELGESDPRLPPNDGDAAPLLPPTGDGCRYLDGTTIAGSLAARRFSSLAATRLGTTHLDGAGDVALGVPLTAGEDAREAPLTTMGEDAREAVFTEGDGSRCLDGAGDEKRRLRADPAGGGAGSATAFLGPRTVLLTESPASMAFVPAEDGMSGGAASDGEAAGWMTYPRVQVAERAMSGSGLPAQGRARDDGTGRSPTARGTGRAKRRRSRWTRWPTRCGRAARSASASAGGSWT